MLHHTQYIKISNYKSIRNVEFETNKVNVFIGRPNVGKSNILEAISLLNLSNSSDSSLLGKGVIRYKNLKNLFYNNHVNHEITVESSFANVILKKTENNPVGFEYIFSKSAKDYIAGKDFTKIFLDMYGVLKQNYHSDNLLICPVKFYVFEKNQEEIEEFQTGKCLFNPFGKNLVYILDTFPLLAEIFQDYLSEYNLEFLIHRDGGNDSLEIQKREGKYVYKYPYSSIADTLQRIIFHLAAIISNKNALILFEEPESHCFPSYIQDLAEKIIEDSSNQFFITTHSPFILNPLIENMDLDKLNVYKVDYQNNESILTKFSKDELCNILSYGKDIFSRV